MSNAIDRIDVRAVNGADYPEAGNIGPGHVHAIVLDLSPSLDSVGIRNGLIRMTDTWRLSIVPEPTTGQQRALSGIGALWVR